MNEHLVPIGQVPVKIATSFAGESWTLRDHKGRRSIHLITPGSSGQQQQGMYGRNYQDGLAADFGGSSMASPDPEEK